MISKRKLIEERKFARIKEKHYLKENKLINFSSIQDKKDEGKSRYIMNRES